MVVGSNLRLLLYLAIRFNNRSRLIITDSVRVGRDGDNNGAFEQRTCRLVMITVRHNIVPVNLHCADGNAVILMACAVLASVRIAAVEVERVQLSILEYG